MKSLNNPFRIPILVFLIVCCNLVIIQLKVDNSMLLFERFFQYGGWIQLILISTYGAVIAYHIQDPIKSSKWRKISWTVFSVWFFLQLALGILVSEKFLLTGKLHLPIPAMMIAGPVYRTQLSIMTLLFLSTIILSGSAWCNQLCYFGAIDNHLASKITGGNSVLKHKMLLKNGVLVLVIVGALLFKFFNTNAIIATIAGLSFGIIGLAVIVIYSRKQGKMVHCVLYCPIGTIVNYFSRINPFRITISNKCTGCYKCIPTCKYDALNISDIKNLKPALSCTLCGDCISSCHHQALEYKFPGMSPAKARSLYIIITVSLHALFMALGRI